MGTHLEGVWKSTDSKCCHHRGLSPKMLASDTLCCKVHLWPELLQNPSFYLEAPS